MMPIITKVEAARRRAAREAAAKRSTVTENPIEPIIPAASEPAPVETPDEVSTANSPASGEPETSPASKRKKLRDHATKDENGKWQPTGDYAHGFARTPEHSRFKPGGKGGPGRPKGSVSHDKLLAKHLNQKREVSLNGKRQQITARELLVISTLKSAVEGKDKHARSYMLAQNERLFPAPESNLQSTNASTLSASDKLSLAEYEQELRERLREELKAEYEAAREKRDDA